MNFLLTKLTYKKFYGIRVIDFVLVKKVFLRKRIYKYNDLKNILVKPAAFILFNLLLKTPKKVDILNLFMKR